MLKFSKFALLSALLAIATGVQAADDKAAAATEKSVALVNGVAIPQARLDFALKMAAAQKQPDSPELRADIRKQLITLEVLSQAAAKAGLDKQTETKERIEYARQNILADMFVQDYMKSHPISDDVVKQEYESIKARVGNKEFKISHIQTESEEEGNKLVTELKKSKFSKVAKAKSKDPTAKENGGDLGWVVPSKLPQPLAEAVLKLAKGQISAPVKIQYGTPDNPQSDWHIIKLEDVRDLKVPSLEDMKQNITQGMQQIALRKYVEEMNSKAKIE